jgi:ParB-like nuclease domain
VARTAGGAGVPLQDIFNANPAIIREFIGDIDDLMESMDLEGLKVPVLLQPDFKIIDGARRIQAALNLGWETIPAIATNDWETIEDTFLKTLKWERKGLPFLPMRWLELQEQRDILVQIRAASPRGRRAPARPRGTGRDKTRGPYSKVDLDLQPLLRVSISDLKGIQTTAGLLKRIEVEHPDRFQEALEKVMEIEASGNSPWANRPLQLILKPSSLDPAPADERAAKKQSQQFGAAVNVLRTVCRELVDIGNVNAALAPEEARKFFNVINQSLVDLHLARKRLVAAAEYKEREGRNGDIED